MLKVPKKVHDAFNELKDQYDHIYLKQLRGRFYVYRHTYEWQADTQRSKTIAEYLGKIMPDGVFVKRIVSYKDEFEKAKALIAAHGGRIIWEEKKELKELVPQTPQNVKIKDTDLKLLMALSMNARMPVSKLADLAGISEHTATSRTKILEEKLGIKYLLELDIEKLGYIKYLILIKFTEDKPTIKELGEAISGEHRILFAAITKGDYDVIMYVMDEDPLTANNNLFRLRTKPSIKNYKAQWNLIYFAEVYSFMPVNDGFIDNILKNRVWHRTKEMPRPAKSQLKYREFALLKELFANSTVNFAYVDKKYGLSNGTSRYTYHTLKEKGIISRPTISMTNLPMQYIGMLLIANVDESKIQEHRYKWLLDEVEYGEIANKYSLVGNVGAPNGSIAFLPITTGNPIDNVAETVYRELQGSIVKSMIITDVLIGSLCYRRFDNNYSRQYNTLSVLKKIEPAKLTDYE